MRKSEYPLGTFLTTIEGGIAIADHICDLLNQKHCEKGGEE